MKMLKLAAIAAVALTSLSVTATPAAAQRWHHGWRGHHHTRTVCRWVWRHHHRVRICRTVRW